MPISFKHFLKSIYMDDNEVGESFEEWLGGLTYKDICDCGEEYMDSYHATIHHLFNLS